MVDGLEHEFDFSTQLGIIIILIDELIFFGGVGIPPTSHGFSMEVSLKGGTPKYHPYTHICMYIDH